MSHLFGDNTDQAAQAELITKLKKTKKAATSTPDFSELVSVVRDLKEFIGMVKREYEDNLETSDQDQMDQIQQPGVELSLHPLQEMDALINLRGFVTVMLNNYNRSKTEVNEIIAMATLIDNKIVSMLLSNEFKDYIHFNEAKTALAKARENNNIKSGLKIG